MTLEHTSFNRRDFLKTSALLRVDTAAIGIQSLSQTRTPGDTGETWFDKPMRWAQLVLVENDPGQYDPQFWLDYFKRTHSDAACLSAGGIVAYYPTQVPLHHRSAWMKGFRSVRRTAGGLSQAEHVRAGANRPACGAAGGIRRASRLDRRRPKVASAATGQTRSFGLPVRWALTNFEFMTEVHREIMRLYQVDDIFSNRWAGSGLCYCEHCRRNFRMVSGMDLPKTTDPLDPARKNYLFVHFKPSFQPDDCKDFEKLKSLNHALFKRPHEQSAAAMKLASQGFNVSGMEWLDDQKLF